mmetsp:Transcript_22483/g.46729  ORF Transcript_22483/g.46729 Transcript_22483/m.46729 type:complete len:312 (+) Transcript_22483:37-972(+)
MIDFNDGVDSLCSVMSQNSTHVGEKLEHLRTLGELLTQGVVTRNEFLELKMQVLHGGTKERGAGGDEISLRVRRRHVPGPGEHFIRGKTAGGTRPGRSEGTMWGYSHVNSGGMGQQSVPSAVSSSTSTLTSMSTSTPSSAVPYHLPLPGVKVNMFKPMEKPWVRELARRRGKMVMSDTYDTASTGSSEEGEGSTLMQQRELQRRLEEHQRRLAGERKRNGPRIPIPHLVQQKPPPTISRSEPNSARRRSVSAQVVRTNRRSFPGSEFAIRRFPNQDSKHNANNGIVEEGVIINGTTGRVLGPPHTGRGRDA